MDISATGHSRCHVGLRCAARRDAHLFVTRSMIINEGKSSMTVATYLSFDGSCADALHFYEKALGAKVEAMMPYADMPTDMKQKMPKGIDQKIMHGRFKLGDQVLMASDAPPGHYHTPAGFNVCYSVDTPAAAEKAFKALSDGGKVTMPIETTFWAQRFGMVTDKFGTPWMIMCERARA